MRTRREYRLALPADLSIRRTGACVGLKLKAPSRDAVAALGELLLDAYRGTIDYEGEDLAASVAEAEGFFNGKHGRALPEVSVVAWRGGLPVCACLIAWWAERGCPFVSMIATRDDSKRGGIARLVLTEAVRRTGRAGHPEIRAVITEGNEPSHHLFLSLGFEDLGVLVRPS